MDELYLFEGFEFTYKELQVIDGIREKQLTIQNFLMFFGFNRTNELIQAKVLGVVGKNEKGDDLYSFVFFKERSMAVSLDFLLLKIALEKQFGKLPE
ncbi:MAG: hypothetical protein AB9921_02465 [Erysipelotrichaceae bacterium]